MKKGRRRSPEEVQEQCWVSLEPRTLINILVTIMALKGNMIEELTMWQKDTAVEIEDIYSFFSMTFVFYISVIFSMAFLRSRRMADLLETILGSFTNWFRANFEVLRTPKCLEGRLDSLDVGS